MDQQFADSHGIRYSPTNLRIITSSGRVEPILGRVDDPVEVTLNPGTRWQAQHAFTFYVVESRGAFSLLLGRPVSDHFGWWIDPVLRLLFYRPFLQRGEAFDIASLCVVGPSRRSNRAELVVGRTAQFPRPDDELQCSYSAALCTWQGAQLVEPDDGDTCGSTQAMHVADIERAQLEQAQGPARAPPAPPPWLRPAGG